jgi:hypothetical protein
MFHGFAVGYASVLSCLERAKTTTNPPLKMGGTPPLKTTGGQYTRDKPYKEQTNSGKPLALSARESFGRALQHFNIPRTEIGAVVAFWPISGPFASRQAMWKGRDTA